jgi:uncharacterized membrane protein YedE/YeeE
VSEQTVVTLIIGIVLGYLGQRSRMCFVGGFRDFLLVRDTELLRGLLAFFVTAWLAFSAAGLFGLLQDSTITLTNAESASRQALLQGAWPLPMHSVAYAASLSSDALRAVAHAPDAVALSTPLSGLADWFHGLPYSGSYLLLTILAAFSLGALSVLANGCPFRQHVLAAQGMSSAVYYLVGFYGGIVIYDQWVVHWIYRWL